MKCRVCSREISDDARFCEFCGADNMEKKKVYTGEVIDEEEKGEKKAGRRSSAGIVPSYAAMDDARAGLASPFFLLGALAMAAQVVLMLFYTISWRVQEVMAYLNYFFIADSTVLLALRITIVIIAAVELVAVIGFVAAWISGLGKKHSFNPVGLTILQAVSVFMLIIIAFLGLCGLGAAIVASRYFVYIRASGTNSPDGGGIASAIVMAAVAILVFVLVIIFLIKLATSVGRAKKAAAEGIIRKNIAFYNVVFLIGIAVCIVAMAVVSLFTIVPSSLIIILGELCLALSCVLFAVFMIRYRKKMKRYL